MTATDTFLRNVGNQLPSAQRHMPDYRNPRFNLSFQLFIVQNSEKPTLRLTKDADYRKHAGFLPGLLDSSRWDRQFVPTRRNTITTHLCVISRKDAHLLLETCSSKNRKKLGSEHKETRSAGVFSFASKNPTPPATRQLWDTWAEQNTTQQTCGTKTAYEGVGYSLCDTKSRTAATQGRRKPLISEDALSPCPY